MKRASILIGTFALVASAARPAYPCINEVMSKDESIKLVAKVESALEIADYKTAGTAMGRHHAVRDPQLQFRLTDASALIALRARPSEPMSQSTREWTLEHFEERAKLKDVKFKAWLAEALEANGKTERALQILQDLKKRDLMPDAFAYLTLARLSAKAEERDAALASCKTRAKNKAICTLAPAGAKAAAADAKS
jgi:hypothetical protein